jgi:hypothetical protein
MSYLLFKNLGVHNEKEISYDILLRFINTNKDLIINPYKNKIKNSFFSSSNSSNDNFIQELDYGDIENIDYLPEFLNKIFSKSKNIISRLGISHKFSEEETFLISILMCFVHNFNIKTLKEQTYYVNYCFNNIFKDKYVEYLDSKKLLENQDKKNKKQINILDAEKIKQDFYSYLISYFHVNIFILDIDLDKVIFKSDKDISINKKTIFMMKYNSHYEALYISGRKYCIAPNPLINELIRILDLRFEENNLTNYIELNKKVIDKKFNTISYTDKLILNNQRKIIMANVKKQGGDYKTMHDKEKQDVQKLEKQEIKEYSDPETENCDLKIKDIKDTEDNGIQENESLEDSDEDSINILDDEGDTVKPKTFIQEGSEIFIKKKYNEKTLQKLKLQDVQDIAEENNIKLKKDGKTGKAINKTKTELITEILKV